MIKWIYIKTDFKQMFREPIIALLFFLPFLIPIIFWALLTYLLPFIQQYASFSLKGFEQYLVSGVLLMAPSMLGIVMGFLLIDDRDNNITELIQVSPFQINGYLTLRLGLVFITTIITALYGYYILGIMLIKLPTLIFLSLLLGLFGACIAFLLYALADDKVKGLTYAKGLNLLLIFAFADLLTFKWLKFFSMLFPPYWITNIINHPNNITIILAGLFVHALWFLLLFRLYRRKVSMQ